MNRDFRRYAVIVILVVSVVLIFQLTKSGAMSQQEDRLVSRRPWPGVEPVSIVSVNTTNKQGLETGKRFAEDDDWLDGFAVTVKNTYSKTITALEINMVFRREPGDTRPPLGWALHFGPSPTTPEYLQRNRNKVIKVGDTAELRLNEYTYKFLKRAFERNGYSSVKRVELVIVEVGFEDGSVFNSGTFYVQDPANPNDPTKKIPVSKAAVPAGSVSRRPVV